MQKLRNLPLAARLGVAFGALALGLLFVSFVAFRSTDTLKERVGELSAEVPEYTSLVQGLAAHLPEEAHLTVRHLYVFDGELENQDEVAAEFEKLAKADEATLAEMVQTLSESDDPEMVEAGAGVERLRTSYLGYLEATRETIAVSRQETIDEVEERVKSREAYTEQLAPLHDELSATVAENAAGTWPTPPPRAPRPPTRSLRRSGRSSSPGSSAR